jgi:putative ABC transport system permease protein
VVKSLDRKLLRDLGHLKGQIVTVALVVGAGLAGLVGMYSTLWSIESSMQVYYGEQRFGDVFAQAVRAPAALEERIEALPGVRASHTRVVEAVTVPMPELREPATGQVVSVPEGRAPPLNDLSIQQGRYFEAGAADEVIVLDSFARAHGLVPGDSLDVVMAGVLRTYRIVGIAMAPEFVFVGRRGEFFPDDRTIVVLWMPQTSVEAAFEMGGGFNDVVVSLQPGAQVDSVIDGLDRLLEPYGGFGAYDRSDHPSHSLVDSELTQLRTLGLTIPLGFLGIAAFLLNVVLSRLVQLQRPEIAALKAVGYRNGEISAHFFKFVLVILFLGTLLGVGLGAWIGQSMSGQYATFFRFPGFRFAMDVRIVMLGAGVSVLAGLGGAFIALYRVARLAPAEAMQPPAPATYRRTVLERVGWDRLLSGSARMILRELERRPFRFALSTFGLALGAGLLVLGRFGLDAVHQLIEVQFDIGAREDVSVVFSQPQPARVTHSLNALPGVHTVEAQRMVPVRFEYGHRHRDSALLGMAGDAQLRRLVDADGQVLDVPEEGLVMSAVLAEALGLEVGDEVIVRVREGRRQTLTMRVTGVVDDITGLQGYLSLEQLHDALNEPPTITDAFLRVDPDELDGVFRRLEDMPAVEVAREQGYIRRRFEERIDESFGFQIWIIVLVASSITVGVVYNNARVALSMRGRELASLRVLGFTKREVGFILLGEQAIQVLLAIPLGWLLGYGFAVLIVAATDPEAFRFPVVVSAQTYGFAALIVLVSALASGLLVQRQLNRADLTEVLKSRE